MHRQGGCCVTLYLDVPFLLIASMRAFGVNELKY